MRYYKPIATYDKAGDIKELFPFDNYRKLEAATNVVNYYLNGHGQPHEIKGDDEEARIYPDEVETYDLIPVIGDYAVSFKTGDKKLLFGEEKPTTDDYETHGYFIDIYQLTDTEEDGKPLIDQELQAIINQREIENRIIKGLIINEFKARFKKPFQGLDFYTYASKSVEGLGETLGIIERMIIGLDDKIEVWHIQEYEDGVEQFEDDYYDCVNWPQLLLNVRQGIRDGWYVDDLEDFDDEDEPEEI